VTCVLTELGVQVFDAGGKYLRGFGVHDIGPGRFSVPNGIIITPDSRYWVSDMMRHNVQVFDPAGKLLGALGGAEGPGAMLYPSALASDGKGMFAFVETGGKLLRLMWIR
jgi:sugar lactone lactonase YvrE